MARSHALIHVTIWSDDDWRNLSHTAQWLYEALLSQPDLLNLCGVLTLHPRRWSALAADVDQDVVNAALTELEHNRFVVVDRDTDELLIRTFMRHDQVLLKPNIAKAAARAFGAIHSRTIRQAILDALPEHLQQAWPNQIIGASPADCGRILRGETTNPNPNGSTNGSGKGSRNGSGNPSGKGSGNGRVAVAVEGGGGRPSSIPSSSRADEDEHTNEPPPTGTSTLDHHPHRTGVPHWNGNATPWPPPHPPTPEELTHATLTHIAACDLHHELDRGTTIRNHQRWLHTATLTATAAHHDQVTALVAGVDHTTAQPYAIAEQIDPRYGPLDRGKHRSDQAVAQGQAHLQATADHHAEAIPMPDYVRQAIR